MVHASVFTEQLSDIDAELAQLQQLIEAKRQQQQRLLELEDTFSQVSQGITSILDAASELGEGAITKLKGAILALVNPDGTDGGNGGGGGLVSYSAKELMEWQPPEEDTFPTNGNGNGTSPKNPSAPPDEPWATEWACPLMSPLACLLEDAPIVSSTTTTTPATTTAPLYELVMVGDRVGYFRNTKDDSIAAAYVGFNNKNLACLWSDWISRQKLAQDVAVRQAKRLTGFEYELKLSGVSILNIDLLASKNLDKRPPAIKKAAPAPAPTPTPNRSEFKAGMPVMTPDGIGKILSCSEEMKSFSQKDYFEVWLFESEKKLGCYADEMSLAKFVLKRDKSNLLLERYWVEAWDGNKLKTVGSVCLMADKLWSHSRQRGFKIDAFPTRELAAEALLQAIEAEERAWANTQPDALEPAF
jgi:hypothetical protein